MQIYKHISTHMHLHTIRTHTLPLTLIPARAHAPMNIHMHPGIYVRAFTYVNARTCYICNAYYTRVSARTHTHTSTHLRARPHTHTLDTQDAEAISRAVSHRLWARQPLSAGDAGIGRERAMDQMAFLADCLAAEEVCFLCLFGVLSLCLFVCLALSLSLCLSCSRFLSLAFFLAFSYFFLSLISLLFLASPLFPLPDNTCTRTHDADVHHVHHVHHNICT